MPQIEWLPSELSWIEEIALGLIDGRMYLVRALPRWGITELCLTLSKHIGSSSILIHGRQFTEENQATLRKRLDDQISRVYDQHGEAQIIFDDYGHALRRSQGSALHSLLYRVLVDSPTARDIGALFVARPADPLDPKSLGSPLLSRVETKALPQLTADDCAEIGQDLDHAKAETGEATWLFRRYLVRGSRDAELSIIENINQDSKRIADSLPTGAIQVIRGMTSADKADAVSREALRCLGTITNNGFKPSRLVHESTLLKTLSALSPGWPKDFKESVRKFASLLGGVSSAIWVDRWVFANPPQTAHFIKELQKHTGAKVRILTYDDHKPSELRVAIRNSLSGVSNIQVRFMRRADHAALHDRHLVIPSSRTGYTLPTAGVITGLHDPGSAIVTEMPFLSFDYSKCWTRATPVFP